MKIVKIKEAPGEPLTFWPRDLRAPGWHPLAPRRAYSIHRRDAVIRSKCRILNADWATYSNDNQWMYSHAHRASNRVHYRCVYSTRYHDSSSPAVDSDALYLANPCRCAASKDKA